MNNTPRPDALRWILTHSARHIGGDNFNNLTALIANHFVGTNHIGAAQANVIANDQTLELLAGEGCVLTKVSTVNIDLPTKGKLTLGQVIPVGMPGSSQQLLALIIVAQGNFQGV